MNDEHQLRECAGGGGGSAEGESDSGGESAGESGGGFWQGRAVCARDGGGRGADRCGGWEVSAAPAVVGAAGVDGVFGGAGQAFCAEARCGVLWDGAGEGG